MHEKEDERDERARGIHEVIKLNLCLLLVSARMIGGGIELSEYIL